MQGAVFPKREHLGTAYAGNAEWVQTRDENVISLEAYTDATALCSLSTAETAEVDLSLFAEEPSPGRAQLLVVHGAGTGKWLRRLDELASLERDWDSYGSEAPSKTALLGARSVIADVASIVPEDRGLPFFIGPLSGGGVQIEWKGESDSIEVEVAADGALSCLITRGSGPERALEEHDDVRHAELIELICSVVQ